MTTKQKKLTMLIAGFLIGAAASITKGMHIIDSPFLNLCLVLLNYGGMLASLFGLNYFATTYQYEKYPKERTRRMGTVVHEEDTPYVRKEKKIGRNDPCPCGSGRKYKQCCGR